MLFNGKRHEKTLQKIFFTSHGTLHILFIWKKYNCIKPSYYVSDQVTFLKREIDLQMDTRDEMVVTNPYGPEKVSTRSTFHFRKMRKGRQFEMMKCSLMHLSYIFNQEQNWFNCEKIEKENTSF